LAVNAKLNLSNNSNLFRNGKKKRLNIAGINLCKNKIKVQREK